MRGLNFFHGRALVKKLVSRKGVRNSILNLLCGWGESVTALVDYLMKICSLLKMIILHLACIVLLNAPKIKEQRSWESQVGNTARLLFLAQKKNPRFLFM